MADFDYEIPYGSNLIENPTADDEDEYGEIMDWENILGVTIVDGGVDTGDKCFKFAATASMEQDVAIPGAPPDVELEAYFLPGRDIKSTAKIKADIILTLTYGDGSKDRYVIPGKTMIEGY